MTQRDLSETSSVGSRSETSSVRSIQASKDVAEKVKIWEEGLKDLARFSESRWVSQLERLSSSVAREMKRLRTLRRRLADLPENDPERIERTVSTSGLVLAKWAAIPRSLQPVDPALYILVGSPRTNAKQDDLTGGELKKTVQDSHDFPTGRFEPPELIVIKSMRLLKYIDFNIHDGSLPWTNRDENVHYTILRPFKILVFFNEEIRSHLTDLEKRRHDRFSMTEAEYDADWQADPPVDAKIAPRPIDTSTETSSELTGLIKDLRSLVRFMDHYIAPALSRSLDEQVYFSELWNTFPTGTLIFVKNKKVSQKIWRVLQRNGGRFSESDLNAATRHDTPRLPAPTSSRPAPFMIDCYSLDFDGTRYVPVYQSFSIDPYDGMESVMNLPAFPLQAAEDAGFIDTENVLNSARDFIDCTRPTHRDYTGRSLVHTPSGQGAEDAISPSENASQFSEWIDSEVMVDMERALHAVPSWRPSTAEYNPSREDASQEIFIPFDYDNVWDRRSGHAMWETQAEKWQKWDRDHPPTEREDLLLLPERVFAFVFRTRKWACLPLGKGPDGQEMLRKRKPRPEPWNDLELPQGHKQLVQSLIESHLDGNTSRKLHFDLVRAKGKGIIILLHGVPGVGKTSTAECAAEANGRPLLPITCGDLGTSAKEVESKLQEAFQLAQLWNCVLLLDEADVFLAQRSEDDIQRNALVSVFLRVLEYYEGILFLTSNRVGVFDEALKSRLHMALYYPPLEWRYTKRIWETHLQKLTDSGLIDVNHKDIMDCAETLFEGQQRSDSTIGPVWNGRQIRNAFQSAVALAGYKHQGDQKIMLNSTHFEKVSNVSDQFNNYLWSIKSQTDADKAAVWGIRHDQWVRPGMTGGISNQQSVGGNSGSLNQDGLFWYGVNSAAGATAPSYPQPMVPQVPQAMQPMQTFQTQQQPQPHQHQHQQQNQHFATHDQGFMQPNGVLYGGSPQAQPQMGLHHGFSQPQQTQTADQRQFYSMQPQVPSSQAHVPMQQQQQQQQQQQHNQAVPSLKVPQ